MHTFTLGVNKFADLTNAEWKDTLKFNSVEQNIPESKLENTKTKVPEEVDWVDWRDKVSYDYWNKEMIINFQLHIIILRVYWWII